MKSSKHFQLLIGFSNVYSYELPIYIPCAFSLVLSVSFIFKYCFKYCRYQSFACDICCKMFSCSSS